MLKVAQAPAAFMVVLALYAYGRGPGPLEGTWRMAGSIPMNVTFRSDEAEALDIRSVDTDVRGLTAKGSVRRIIASALMQLVLAAPALYISGTASAAEPTTSSTEIYTRGIVRSISAEDGRRLYIRLKLVPQTKIPFSTVTYRVLDAGLVKGLREGESVAFKAERRDGENVLTAVHIAAPCQRFNECK